MVYLVYPKDYYSIIPTLLFDSSDVSMVYLWCILDTPLLRERNRKFLLHLLLVEIIYIVENYDEKIIIVEKGS
jgi:hypothetical protein